jgi:hypothetical protein
MTRPSSVKVTRAELQFKFNTNAGGYPARINALRCECIYDEPASAKSHQPAGTRSRVNKYWDGAIAVMYLHCFVLPTGELGASGKMDAKRLLVDGVYYYCD